MEFIPFTSDFCYLGETIDFLLDNTLDIEARIVKVIKAVGDLNFMWESKKISLEAKKNPLAISLNLSLWNRETWFDNKACLELLDVFCHKTIRKKLVMNMLLVKDDKTNKKN